MKILRGFINSIFGIVLFALIIVLTFTITTKKFVENDLLHETIKSALEESSKDNSTIEKYKAVIDEMFDDSDAKSIINMILENYNAYKTESNYSVSKDDAKEIYDFVLKYKDKIEDLSGENISRMSQKEFEEFFNQAKVDEFAKDAFNEFDKNLDSDTSKTIVNAYVNIMSNKTRIIIIIGIIVCILALIFINFSPIKWMTITGIPLLISGALMTVIYFVIEIFKDAILKETLKFKLDINFNQYLIAGIIEIILGICLIGGYVILKKTVCRKKKHKDNIHQNNINYSHEQNYQNQNINENKIYNESNTNEQNLSNQNIEITSEDTNQNNNI